MRGDEYVNDTRIRCYDDGGKTLDRYTVVFVDEELGPNSFTCLALSEHPFDPMGFGQHCEGVPGKHLGKRIAFADLPPDCRKVIHEDTKED